MLDHRRVEEIFQQAADLPPEQRRSFLDANCDDPAVREEVDSLLAYLGRSRIASLEAVDLLDKTDAELVDEQVGPYRLVELIGEGGFGAVYLAEQERPVRRRVAVKVLKLGMDTKQVVARFEAERQALAMMEHPNIARVFDAGATETGRPYFAMELVRGVPIIEHCNENRSTTKERLELFIQVCRGVQHAHQKGIIHRDLKPSNVLVTLHDGVPMPKIIDFGIAKATDQPLTEGTLFTGFRQFVGTPEYVSPEQAGMSRADVDTRSDIYSLGVLLYELLTGMTPFDSRVFRSATYPEMQRIICEQNPTTPSRRLSTLGTNLTQIAAARQTEPHVLRRLLRGDLDWIVMKALEKDRNRRYETAAAMADDVQRHLDHEPVSAGPPGAIYRLRKLATRHRAAFGFAAAMLGVVLAFGVWMSFLYVEANELRLQAQADRGVAEANLGRAQEAEERAKKAADTAAQVAQILAGLFEATDPLRVEGARVTARDVLDDGADRVWDGLKDQPQTQAALMATVGRVYTNLGHFAKAEPLLRRAMEIRMASLGESHRDTISSMTDLGRSFMLENRFTEAELLLRRSMKLAQHTLGEDDPETITAASCLSWTLQSAGRYREAEPLGRQALETHRRIYGNDHPKTLAAINALSWLLQCVNKYDEAEKLSREALETSLRVFGEDNVCTAESMNVLGTLLLAQNRLAEAEPLVQGAAAVRQRLLGHDHLDTLESIENAAGLARQQGKLVEAEARYREALAGYRRVHGAEHRRTFRCACDLGNVLSNQGKYAEAEPLLEEALTGLRLAVGDDHRDSLECLVTWLHVLAAQENFAKAEGTLREMLPALRTADREGDIRVLRYMDQVAELLHNQGNSAEAEPLLVESLVGMRREFGDQHDSTLRCLAQWFELLSEQGHLAEHEHVFLDILASHRETLGRQHPTTLTSMTYVARVLQSQEQLAEAEGMLREVLEIAREKAGSGLCEACLIGIPTSLLGDCLSAQGRYEEAEPLLLQGYTIIEKGHGESDKRTQGAIARIVRFYESLGKPDQADKWRSKVPAKTDK